MASWTHKIADLDQIKTPKPVGLTALNDVGSILHSEIIFGSLEPKTYGDSIPRHWKGPQTWDHILVLLGS